MDRSHREPAGASAMAVFLTGGTGLLGSHVADLLCRRGHPVTCLQRPTSDTTHLRSLGCRIAPGDVRDDPGQLAEAMGGCDVLVHSAALVYPDVPWPELRAVNVEGTRRVLKAAGIAGLRRAVHISSVAVYGDAPFTGEPGEPLEWMPAVTEKGDGEDGEKAGHGSVDGALGPYARSKRRAEAEAVRAAAGGRLGLCILRPAGVYGERDRGLTPTLASLTRLPVTPLLGAGDHTLPIVYAGNVATAVALLLREPEAAGRVYDVGEDDPVTQREALRALARGMDVEPRFVSIPVGLAEAGAWLWDGLRRRLGGSEGPRALRLVRLASRDNPFSSAALRDELGWRPPAGATEALSRTGRWLRENRRDSRERR